MTKKTSRSLQPKKIKAVKEETNGEKGSQEVRQEVGPTNLPPEIEKKLKALKDKLDSFKTKVLDKFGDYIVGIALLPPEKNPKGENKGAR